MNSIEVKFDQYLFSSFLYPRLESSASEVHAPSHSRTRPLDAITVHPFHLSCHALVQLSAASSILMTENKESEFNIL